MKFILALAIWALAGCGVLAPASTPASPNFVVVSTDWRQTLVAPTQHERCVTYINGTCTQWQDRAALYQWTAHGVFRNQGASGSVGVTFTGPEGLPARVRRENSVNRGQVALIAPR